MWLKNVSWVLCCILISEFDFSEQEKQMRIVCDLKRKQFRIPTLHTEASMTHHVTDAQYHLCLKSYNASRNRVFFILEHKAINGTQQSQNHFN